MLWITGKEQKTKVLAAFRKKQLTIIPIGASLEYFRGFNSNGRNDIEKQLKNAKDSQRIFVSMDGYLVLTDGHVVEQISCSWKNGVRSTDIILSLPITWKTVPQTAIVIEEN